MGSPVSPPYSIPSFCFGFSGIEFGFDHSVLFSVIRHCVQIRSLCFISGSLTFLLDSIPSFFYFWFFDISPRFDPFLFLFRVFRHRAQIQSLCFDLGSLASRPNSIPSFFILGSLESHLDSISSFCFSFFGIVPRFDPFLLFRVLRLCARIRSLYLDSSSLALHLDSIPSFYFRFSSIVPKFDLFLLMRVLWHCAQIQYIPFNSDSLALRPDSIPSFLISSSPASRLDSIPSF